MMVMMMTMMMMMATELIICFVCYAFTAKLCHAMPCRASLCLLCYDDDGGGGGDDD